MKSRRDQVQAHAYVVGRLTAALVHGEPDAPESPMRRTALGSFGGLMLGALGVAGFLILGFIFPSATAAVFKSGELVMVKETGSRYIYARGALHPVLNWSSAMLLMGGNGTMTSVSAASMANVPQGQPVGIVGAPDTLPAAKSVNTGAWLICALSSGGRPQVSLTIGVPAPLSPVPPTGAVIVQAPAGGQYLLYGGHRMRLDAPWIAGALGLGRAPVIDVRAAWLNAVPAAADLQPVPVPGRGGQGPTLGGRRTTIGQVLVVGNVGSSSQFYLASTGAVIPITPTQAAVLLTDPATIGVYQGAAVAPIPVSSAIIAGANVVHQALPDGGDGDGAPPSPPASFAPGAPQVPCVSYPPSGAVAPALVFAVPPAAARPGQGMAAVSVTPEGADRIKVAPGTGALVRPQAAPGVGASSLFLVTDAGVKFPVPSATAAAALGYSAGRAARLPAALLGLLPTGPALNLQAIGG